MKLLFKYLILLPVLLLPGKEPSAHVYKETFEPAEPIVLIPGKVISDSLTNIGFLSLNSYSESGSEIRATYDFLKGVKTIHSEYITFAELRKHPGILDQFDILWFHRPDSTGFSDKETDPKILRSIKQYLVNGGNLFLTLGAFKYIMPLGLETVSPRDSIKSCIDEGYGRKLGLHSFREHPVFTGLNGGAYIWTPDKNLSTRITGYFGNMKPEKGKVIAVDWDYIFLQEGSKLLIEYNSGKGKVIAAGAYTWYSEPNFNRAHLELFTTNIFFIPY